MAINPSSIWIFLQVAAPSFRDSATLSSTEEEEAVEEAKEGRIGSWNA